jgi:hypothetical protein
MREPIAIAIAITITAWFYHFMHIMFCLDVEFEYNGPV